MLIGVPSYGSSVAQSRRASIRSLSGANHSSQVLLRFILADDQQPLDLAEGDLWTFTLPPQRRARNNYGLEKWLLCDAFLRRAVRTTVPGSGHHYDFIVLADDDTLYYAPAMVRVAHPLTQPARLTGGG